MVGLALEELYDRPALFIRAISVRSRHLMARFRLAHITGSLIAETVPRVLELCFPELRVVHHKSDRFYELPNGSEIWYAGLTTKSAPRFGRSSPPSSSMSAPQIPWASRNIVLTRLAQKTTLPNPDDPDGKKGLDLLPGLRLQGPLRLQPAAEDALDL